MNAFDYLLIACIAIFLIRTVWMLVKRFKDSKDCGDCSSCGGSCSSKSKSQKEK